MYPAAETHLVSFVEVVMLEPISAKPAPRPRQVALWMIDPAHSSVTFRVRHMMISDVRGEFETISGAVSYDPDDVEATRIRATIGAASIHTRDDNRDAHLRSSDFLDVEHFPTIEFVSTAVRQKPDLGLAVEGELTIRGVSRRVVLDVEGPDVGGKDPSGALRLGASARTTIRRSDFGITWNALIEAGGVLVADEVRIEIDLSLIR